MIIKYNYTRSLIRNVQLYYKYLPNIIVCGTGRQNIVSVLLLKIDYPDFGVKSCGILNTAHQLSKLALYTC